MNSARLFSILAAIVTAIVIMVILLSLREIPPTPQPEPPQATAPVSMVEQTVTPGGPASGEPDLTVSHPLTLEDVAPLYTALQKRIDEYKTVHVRTRLEFPIAARNQIVESYLSFDAVRPHRFIHKSIKSVPKNKKSMSSEFVPVPYLTEIYDGSQLTVISHPKRNIHKVDLSATDIASRAVVGPMTIQCATRMANPLQDLLFGVSFEDRLKEMAEAKREKTSQGEQIQVLFRITGAMSQVIQRTTLMGSLPVFIEGLKMMSLRRDIFDAQTGKLLQSVYLTAQWHPYLIQTYQEAEWDVEIPEDRFLVDAPPGSTVLNTNENLRRTRRLGLTEKDLEEYRRAGNPVSASSLLDLKRRKEREKGMDPSN